jgi:hypothetical protein
MTADDEPQDADQCDFAELATAELKKIAFMDLGDTPRDWPASLVNVKRAALVDLVKLDEKFKQQHEQGGGLCWEDALKELE